MNEGPRRRVTRGYLWGLIFAVNIVCIALIVASWGGLALATSGGPVSTPGIGRWVAAMIILVAVVALVWGLWSQSLLLLRGRKSPPWAYMLLLGVGGYLIWCLGGLSAGLSVQDTWLSPYAATLALTWAIGSLLCWFVLARRVYTERPTPQWPWEKRGEPGPDWIGEHPWGGRQEGDEDRNGDETEGPAR